MTLREDILRIVDTEGFIWLSCHTSVAQDRIIYELEEEGTLESLESAGINFMNGSYCFIRKGNPDKVYIKTVDNTSEPIKGE